MDRRQRWALFAIEEAFRGVTLGGGVSLRESVVIDDYGSERERRRVRLGDEKTDWSRLIDDPEFSTIGHIGGPCFFDDLGFRFHLPAYLSLAVREFENGGIGAGVESMLFNLTAMSENQREKAAILDPSQRRCVYEVLDYLRDRYQLDDEDLDDALAEYWGADPGDAGVGG